MVIGEIVETAAAKSEAEARADAGEAPRSDHITYQSIRMQTQVGEVKMTMGQGGAAPAADQDRTTSPSTLAAVRLGRVL